LRQAIINDTWFLWEYDMNFNLEQAKLNKLLLVIRSTIVSWRPDAWTPWIRRSEKSIGPGKGTRLQCTTFALQVKGWIFLLVNRR